MATEPILVRKAILPSSQEIDRMVQVLRTALRGDMHVAAMVTTQNNMESQFFVSQVRQGLTYGEVYVAGSGGRIDGVLIAFAPTTNKLTSDVAYVSQLPREMQEWWYQHLIPKYEELATAALGSKDAFKAVWHATILAVHPDHQKTGIARLLMETLLSKAQAHGQTVCLNVWNDHQVRFCAHFGLQVLATKNVSSYQGGFPLFFMARQYPLPG